MLLKKLLCLFIATMTVICIVVLNSSLSPLRDKKISYNYNNTIYKFNYPRIEDEAQVLFQFNIPQEKIPPIIYYSSQENVSDSIIMKKLGDNFVSLTPKFNRGDKINYYVKFNTGVLNPDINSNNSITLLFRKGLPLYIQITLITLYYGALFFLILHLLYRFFSLTPYKHISTHLYKVFTFFFVLLPVLNYIIYGKIWTYYPLFTDINILKVTLLALVAWGERFYVEIWAKKLPQLLYYTIIIITLICLLPTIWLL